MKAVLLRTGCILVLSLISSLAYLLDVLWPLWDDKRQAIHDKAAATNVVLGPQPDVRSERWSERRPASVSGQGEEELL